MYDFSLPYNRKNFLSFLKDIFPDDLVNEEIEYKDETSEDLTKKIFKIGELKSFNDLQIFEIEHLSINDPRVTLTKKVFSLFKKLSISKAIVLFYCQNSNNYRFSLIESSYKWLSDKVVTREFSMPKRFSFFLGPGAKIHTPSNQFKKQIKSYEDLKSRFNIEVVSDEFFENYKSLYLKIVQFLEKDKKFIEFLNKREIKSDLFSKKLLGQIVFCYFLQKKNCLGAKKNQHLSNGDQFFLRNKFEECKKNNLNFYNDFLEHLFYNGLNNENKNNFVESLGCKIPYLNGGLFEEIDGYDWNKEFLDIPNSIFSNNSNNGILDIFDLYNFTVDEHDELDIEIGIDPEMLGKVFEKLLPENFKKGKGSFYTPRFVVSFMSKQIIKNFLISKQDLKDCENFIYELVNFDFLDEESLFEKIKNFDNEKLLHAIDSYLNNIKICDPAIGSGAFPVLIMNEVTKIRSRILNFLKKDYDIYSLKRDFIENSIYGVDIDKGAVEISKLRLWLSLIVEEKNINNIHPLPNLSYKILQGNSLIQKFKNYDFDDQKSTNDGLFEDHETDQIKQELIKIQKKYFNLSSRKKKKELRILLDRAIETLIFKKINNLKDKNIFSNKVERNFFLWKIFFLDVFENGGFDIVIGNPPYVFARSSKLKNFKENDKEYFVKKYALAQYQLNTYSLFVELGANLLKDNGFLSYIIPHNWMTINTNEEFRKLVLSNSRIEIINFSKKVFKNAEVDACVLNFCNNKKDVDSKITIYQEENEIINKQYSNKTKILNDENYNYIINFDIVGDPKLKEITNKIITNSKTLYPYFAVAKTGIVAYEKGKGEPKQSQKMIDDRVYHSDKRENENFSKYLEGEDVNRYYIDWSKTYVQYGKNLAAPRSSNLFNGSRILVRQIPSKPPYCISASFVNSKYINDRNSMNLIDLKIDHRIILGIINSKLISFWFIVRFAKLQRDLFPQFKLNELEKFPIINVNNKKIEKDLISLVDQVINKPEDYKLNDKIDNLIYDIFSISKDEKNYIESYLNKFN